jgi:hypothetical protein
MPGAQAIEEAAFKVYLRSQRRCTINAATIIIFKLQACVSLSSEDAFIDEVHSEIYPDISISSQWFEGCHGSLSIFNCTTA